MAKKLNEKYLYTLNPMQNPSYVQTLDGFEEGSTGYESQTWFIVQEDYYAEKINKAEFKSFVIDIGQNISPEIINNNTSWIKYMDYTYSCISGAGCIDINTFDTFMCDNGT